MSIYRNTGAGWTRPDGTRIGPGAEFEPTDEERKRKAHKLQLVGQSGAPVTRADLELDDYETGNGWFLIGGEKFHGREAAADALAALKAEERRIRETHLPKEGA